MDSKGYIPISLLASFNRIKQLTLDTRLVKEVLLLSAFVEVNGGMVRMGGVGGGAPSGSVSSVGNTDSQQIRSSSSWESFVLPDAVESVVEDVAMENVGVDNSYGGYHQQQQQQQQQQINGYGYGGGSGYGYGYGAAGYGYGYGYGYPPVGPTVGLGYYEDPQSQLQQQQQQQQASGGGGGGGGYEPGEGAADEQEHASSETVPRPSMLMNGHTAESTTSINTTTTRKLDDPPPPTSSLHSKEKKEGEIKLNGIFKHDQQRQHGDEGGEEYGGEEGEEEEEEEEEEDVVFVMGGTDVSTSWAAPERERRA